MPKCRILFTCLALGCVSGCAGVPRSGTPDAVLAIVGATVITSADAPPLPNGAVVVRNGRIVDVGPAGAVTVPRGATVVDARGRFVIPGLWDMHVHLARLEDRSLALFVANGVTGVRDMGGHTERLLVLRGAVEAGRIVGPRIRTPGAILESPRWLQWMAEVDSALGASDEWRQGRIGVADEQRAAVVVDSLHRQGVDFIKVRTVASPSVFFAIARAAREAGLPLAGHYPFGSDPFAVADSGFQTLEHGFYFALFDASPERRDSVFRRFADRHVAVTPTGVAGRYFRETPDSIVFGFLGDSTNTLFPLRRYASPSNLRDWRETMEAKKEEDPPLDGDEMRQGLLRDLRGLRAAGVTILAGTDAPTVLTLPGYSLHDELADLVRELGLSPAEALRAATSTAAASLGIADAGEIRAGNLADLVILSANPLQDIAAIRRVEAVVLRGRLFDRGRLDALLRQAEF